MTANEVDAALRRDTRLVGPSLSELDEDQWFERKSIRVAPKDVAIAMVALANAEGGVIVVGLHDGRVEGSNAFPAKVNAIRQTSLDHTRPPVRARVDQVRCLNEKGELDTVLVVRVDPGEVVHELTNGDCYLRVGDESRKLNFVQRQELYFDRGQGQFDGQRVADSSLADLDSELLRGYREAIGALNNDEQLLRARSLLTAKGELTNAAYLLFATQPGLRFPQAHVRVVRFLSSERGTGASLGVDDDNDHRIEGPIPVVIPRAAEIIEALVPRRRSLGPDGTFQGQPIVPRDAWLEGLVNAVIHRSYSLGGDHIRVEVYPDRVEVESPGRFPGLADTSHPLDISRFARNPRIARVCADLRIGQELGEGIRRIFAEMRRLGLADPIYTQSSGSVRLTLRAVSRLDEDTMRRLPRGALVALDVLRGADQPLGTGDIQEALLVSRPTATRYLRALLAEELVDWSGKTKQDPRAVWTLRH